MRVPLSWVQEYVDLRDISALEIASRLTKAGLEVAEIEYTGVAPAETSGATVSVAAITTGTSFPWDRERIRVAEVVGVERHPNADRLVLATVNYGGEAPQTVVTGAPNVRVGQRVAFATVGATVRNGHSETHEMVTLKPAKLRGVRSEGMVLSELELGLSDEHVGIIELPDDAPIGTPLADYLGDVVLTVELTANLARAYSIIGVARELAALFDRPLKPVPTDLLQEGPSIEGQVEIRITDPQACPRFTALLIRDVTIAPAPFWVQRRLRLAGMRPINNIVDITNYVMLETGQPLHAFDYDVLVRRAAASQQPANPATGEARPTITMRYARAGERLTTLDDQERTLAATDHLVTDSGGSLSLAGVMGGQEGEVSDTTRTVLLEAANWDYIMIRRTSKRHQLFSEAALRFSRGVHPDQAALGNRRAAELMRTLAGGTVAAGMVDVYPAPAPTLRVDLTTAEVVRQLGMELPVERIAHHLRALEFEVEILDEGRLSVTAPNHRLDITGPHDLIEEIARIEGYDDLPATLMSDPLPPMRVDPTLAQEEQLRDLLVGAGLQEIVSYALTSPEREALLVPHGDPNDVTTAGYIQLANPSTQERCVMRRTLLVSAMETLQRNLGHRSNLAFFEIGQAYLPTASRARTGAEGLLPEESRRVLITLAGPTRAPSWQEPTPPPADFFDLKGIVEAVLAHLHLTDRARFVPTDHPSFQPGRVATVLIDDQPVGTIGEIHPLVREAHSLPTGLRIPVAELALDTLIAASPAQWKVTSLSRYPAVVQDLAVVVGEELPAATVAETIRRAGGDLLRDVALFDLYRGPNIPEGTRSLAYTLTYQAPDRTLRDAEVAARHAAIVRALRDELGAEIRGEA